MNAKGAPVKVIKGQVIGCDLCHTLAKSFTDSPKGEAKLHAPPQPELFTIQTTGPGADTSMGGMSH
jgi:hypothetical protein